jgi:hypothetical protein
MSIVRTAEAGGTSLSDPLPDAKTTLPAVHHAVTSSNGRKAAAPLTGSGRRDAVDRSNDITEYVGR